MADGSNILGINKSKGTVDILLLAANSYTCIFVQCPHYVWKGLSFPVVTLGKVLETFMLELSPKF